MSKLSKSQQKTTLKLVVKKVRHWHRCPKCPDIDVPFSLLSGKRQDIDVSKIKKPTRHRDNWTSLACRPLTMVAPNFKCQLWLKFIYRKIVFSSGCSSIRSHSSSKTPTNDLPLFIFKYSSTEPVTRTPRTTINWLCVEIFRLYSEGLRIDFKFYRN